MFRIYAILALFLAAAPAWALGDEAILFDLTHALKDGGTARTTLYAEGCRGRLVAAEHWNSGEVFTFISSFDMNELAENPQVPVKNANLRHAVDLVLFYPVRPSDSFNEAMPAFYDLLRVLLAEKGDAPKGWLDERMRDELAAGRAGEFNRRNTVERLVEAGELRRAHVDMFKGIGIPAMASETPSITGAIREHIRLNCR